MCGIKHCREEKQVDISDIASQSLLHVVPTLKIPACYSSNLGKVWFRNIRLLKLLIMQLVYSAPDCLYPGDNITMRVILFSLRKSSSGF